MSNYPESVDVFVDKTGGDNISSSDPNNAFDGVEATQGLIGAIGKPQSWSETLMRVMRYYRRGLRVEMNGADLTVRSGEACLVDTNGNKYAFRCNPADVVLSSANLDSGSLAATFYYVYARSLGAALTAPVVYSTDINAPASIGTHPYMKIGWFKNEAVGSLACTFAGSWRQHGNEHNFCYAGLSTGTDSTTATTAYVPMAGMLVNFVSSGRPVKIIFKSSISHDQINSWVHGVINIDGTDYVESENVAPANGGNSGAGGTYSGFVAVIGTALAPGAHVIKGRWKTYQPVAYAKYRNLLVEEL